jgi:hypothetical protein
MELNSVLLPLFGWPMKMTVGTSAGLMDGFDDDLLGDAPSKGDGRVRGAVADEQGPAEDGLAVELDDIVLVESQGHQPAADALATAKVDDPQGFVMGRVEEVHGRSSSPVYPSFTMNQDKLSEPRDNPYRNYRE